MWYADDVILLSSIEVIIIYECVVCWWCHFIILEGKQYLRGVKITNAQFGQNFKAIFRENEGLPEHGTTPVEFVMPKSSFPQKFGQGFAP